MTVKRFGRASRLLNARDFKNVFDHSRLKVSSPELLFLATPNQLPYARLGLVIAKKHVRRAVGRNRVKRIVRETFRLQQDELAGLDIVVLGRKGLDTLDKPQLQHGCQELWQHLQRRARKQLRRENSECDGS